MEFDPTLKRGEGLKPERADLNQPENFPEEKINIYNELEDRTGILIEVGDSEKDTEGFTIRKENGHFEIKGPFYLCPKFVEIENDELGMPKVGYVEEDAPFFGILATGKAMEVYLKEPTPNGNLSFTTSKIRRLSNYAVDTSNLEEPNKSGL